MEEKKEKRGRKRRDYSAFLAPGETVDMVPGGVLRKRAFDQKQRDQKQDREELSAIPDAIDWTCSWSTRFPEQAAELKQFISETINKISQEIQLPTDRRDHDDIEEIISRVCMCSQAYSKNSWVWVKKCAQGFAVSGSYIPTYAGDDLIPATNYYNLKRSETFSQLYMDVLRELDKRYGTLQDSSINLIRQELARTYQLPETWLPYWKQPKPVKVEEVKPEVKSYRTNEEIKLEPSVPQQPPQVPVFRPPSVVPYCTADNLNPSAQAYLAGCKDPYPQRAHLGPYGSKDRRFLYGEG